MNSTECHHLLAAAQYLRVLLLLHALHSTHTRTHTRLLPFLVILILVLGESVAVVPYGSLLGVPISTVSFNGLSPWWSASGGVLESLGYKQGFRVDVDVPEGTWAEAPKFHDVIIVNTGHWWWAPSKFDPINSPMLFFEKGLPVIPPVQPDIGLDMVLKHMVSFVDKSMRANGIRFFRTQSPRHFEGGDWDQGGSCQRVQPLSLEQVDTFFSLENNGTNMEARLVNQHLYKALKGSSFRILDITHMSEFRADAHPSTAGGKKHDDCMHWCLPGVTDTWNDLLYAYLVNI